MFMEFIERYKKILLLLGFVGLTMLIGYFIYALFFKPAVGPAPVTGGLQSTTTGQGLPVAGTGKGQVVKEIGEPAPVTGEADGQPARQASATANGGLTETAEVSGLPTIGATTAGDGKELQYYNSADGKFYKIDDRGEVVPLSDKVFHQVQKVTWSPVKTEAILEYPDNSKIIYDFESKKQITLPSHWKDFSFSPAGDRIVMKSMGNDPDNRWLAVVASDGSQVRGIESLGDKDSTVYPAWSPNNQMVAMYTEGIDFNRQDVYFVGLNGENFKSMTVEGRGFDPKWQPDGKELLYSVYSTDSEMKPELWMAQAEGDQIGSNRRKLNLQTWASKCSFAGTEALYCAVPQSLDQGAGLFPELANGTVDRLYRIDLATGAKKLIAVPAGNYTIDNLNITADQKNIFFNDRSTGKLYKIKLK